MFLATLFSLKKKHGKCSLYCGLPCLSSFVADKFPSFSFIVRSIFWLFSLVQNRKPMQYMEPKVLFSHCLLLVDHFWNVQRTASTNVTVTGKHILFHLLVLKLGNSVAISFYASDISFFSTRFVERTNATVPNTNHTPPHICTPQMTFEHFLCQFYLKKVIIMK